MDCSALIALGFVADPENPCGKFTFLDSKNNLLFGLSITETPSKFWGYQFSASMFCNVGKENSSTVFLGLVFESMDDLIGVIKKTPLFEYITSPKIQDS